MGYGGTPPQEWNSSDVGHWLGTIGLGHLASSFATNGGECGRAMQAWHRWRGGGSRCQAPWAARTLLRTPARHERGGAGLRCAATSPRYEYPRPAAHRTVVGSDLGTLTAEDLCGSLGATPFQAKKIQAELVKLGVQATTGYPGQWVPLAAARARASRTAGAGGGRGAGCWLGCAVVQAIGSAVCSTTR